MFTVAKLDDTGILVGSRQVKNLTDKHIECGDLPTNGTYFWTGKAFVPQGFGKGKPHPPGVSRDRAVFLLMRALIDGKPIPIECRKWCDWYERHHG